jgi:hypothetical protein
MGPVETILCLPVAVAALATLARRLRIAEPIPLVLGGLALGFIPTVADVEFPPEVVFLLFIPPLVFLGAYRNPWRDFKSNLRPISGMDRYPIQHRCYHGAVDERLERQTSESTTRRSGPVLVSFVLAGLQERHPDRRVRPRPPAGGRLGRGR